MRLRRLFVQLDAESGTVRRIHEAIGEAHILVDYVLAPRHVVEKRLVNAVARRRDAQGKRDGVGDRPRRIVCAERNMVRVADGGYLLHPRDAARMRRVGLQVVAAAKLYRVQNLLSGEEPFAAGNRHLHAAPDIRKRPHRVRNDRLLHPIGLELLERIADAKRSRHVEAPVALYEDFRLALGSGLDRRDALHRLLEVLRWKLAVVLPERIPLEPPEARLHRNSRLCRELLRLLRAGEPAVGVARNSIAALAADELPYRKPQGLPLDVPERHVDCGERGHEDRPAAPVGVAVVLVEYPFRVERILADKRML